MTAGSPDWRAVNSSICSLWMVFCFATCVLWPCTGSFWVPPVFNCAVLCNQFRVLWDTVTRGQRGGKAKETVGSRLWSLCLVWELGRTFTIIHRIIPFAASVEKASSSPLLKVGSAQGFLRAVFSWGSNISKDGDSSTSLGKLFPYLVPSQNKKNVKSCV